MFQFIFVEPNLSLDTIADISNMYLHYLITTNKRKVGYEKLRCKDEKGIVIYLHPFLAKLSKIHYEAGDEFFYVRNKNNTEFSAEYEEVTKEDYTWEVKFFKINRNDEFINNLLVVTQAFYNQNMVMKIPPKPTLKDKEVVEEVIDSFAIIYRSIKGKRRHTC